MTGIDDLALARALHVLGAVVWIGGVAMATFVILPAVRQGTLGQDRLAIFSAIEHRFVWIARAMVVLVGVSGFYMTERYDLWWRFSDPGQWWMHAMIGIWGVFVALLFFGEPFVLSRYFPGWAARYPDRAFAVLHWVHVALATLALITVFAATAGVHGPLLR